MAFNSVNVIKAALVDIIERLNAGHRLPCATAVVSHHNVKSYRFHIVDVAPRYLHQDHSVRVFALAQDAVADLGYDNLTYETSSGWFTYVRHQALGD